MADQQEPLVLRAKKEMAGLFDRMPVTQQEWIKHVHANFHVRNGVVHPDDSTGDIRMTPGQLRDALAFALAQGARDAFVANLSKGRPSA